MRLPHRSTAFFRAYRYLPHRWINRGFAAFTALRRPGWLVDEAVALWTRLAHIDLSEYEPRRFCSLDDFFVRRLRPGMRPLGEGFVAPADGRLIAAGLVALEAPLRIKKQRLSVPRLVNGDLHGLELRAYDGANFAVVFLTPGGYHRVHMPIDGELLEVCWIPGRYFPQNEDALEHVPRIYERNERAVLRCRAALGFEFLLIMVGASLIGGIELACRARSEWARPSAVVLGCKLAKGEELGHFAFGSTVVVLLPRGTGRNLPLAPAVRMGQTLFDIG